MWVHGYFGGFPPFPPFPFFLFPLLLVLLVAFIVFRRGHWTRFDQALGVLRERYARGEIDAEEYHARKDELSSR